MSRKAFGLDNFQCFFNCYFFIIQHCFDEAAKPYDESTGREKKLSKDDWAHGSLLVINELLRCSNMEGEVDYCSLGLFLQIFIQQ